MHTKCQKIVLALDDDENKPVWPTWAVEDDAENKTVWPTWAVVVLPGVRDVETYDREGPS
jgi:hypothetical protein